MTNAEELSSFSFADYRKTEFVLVSYLQQLHDYAQRFDMDELAQHIAQAVENVQNHTFSIAIVGEFKRGKSTVINALLGKEILPADIMPTSATLNRVTYGIAPVVRVYFKHAADEHQPFQEIAVDELAAYVTKLTPEAEAVAATVREAVVYYPLRYCENNVSIIDTPGLNDDEAMTRITLDVLPQIDAAVMVVMANSPFSQFEGDFLSNLLTKALGRVFFVVTAIDRIRRPEDRERILNEISNRIQTNIEHCAAEQFGQDTEEYHLYIQRVGKPKVFGVSGYDALQGKTENDSALLEQSGFQVFETALEKFLTEERGAATLKVLTERIVDFGEKVQRKITVQHGALQIQHREFEQMYQELVHEIDNLRSQSEQEIERLNLAVRHTQNRIHPYVYYLGPEMIKSAGQIIDNAVLTNADLNQASIDAMISFGEGLFKKVKQRIRSDAPAPATSEETLLDPANQASSSNLAMLSQNISQAITQFIDMATARIQQEIQNDVAAEVVHVRAFAAQLQQVLYEREMQFVQHTEKPTGERSVLSDGMVEGLSVISELGQLWSGYYDIGLKSAAMGSLASLRDTVSNILQNLRSLFSKEQNDTSRANVDRVTVFKESYKKALTEQIETQLNALALDTRVNDQIAHTFEGLKQKVQEEVATALAKYQHNLEELRYKRTRSEALSDRELEDLETMRTDVQRILQQTYQLSDQVATILNR